jgi:uncharacterized protein (TIGR02284 family)
MIATLILMQSRARRTLRELIAACRRDVAFYRKRALQIDDREVRAALEEIIAARQHLVAALANVPGSSLPGQGLLGAGAGTLRSWEMALRAHFGRADALEIADDLEQGESTLLERMEDAVLDRRLGAGLRISLERHLPLLRGAQERAVTAANRLRLRHARSQRKGATSRPVQASLSRSVAPLPRH